MVLIITHRKEQSTKRRKHQANVKRWTDLVRASTSSSLTRDDEEHAADEQATSPETSTNADGDSNSSRQPDSNVVSSAVSTVDDAALAHIQKHVTSAGVAETVENKAEASKNNKTKNYPGLLAKMRKAVTIDVPHSAGSQRQRGDLMQDQGSYVDAFEDPLLCVLVSAAKTY
jgi:hypothetical protein